MSASGYALAATLLLGSVAAAEEAALPDADFLEYLGSWEGVDDEWLIFDEQAQEKPEQKRTGAEPRREQATEKDDES
jgi:hypothetical protein